MLLLGPERVAALGARGCFVWEGFLDEAAALRARGELEALAARLRPAGMGRGGAYRDEAERGDEILWLDGGAGGPGLSVLAERLDALGEALSREAYLGLRSHERQAARYPGGGARYARHRDAFREAVGSRRRVTAIVYLNPGWAPADGGLLRLHLEDDPFDVAPRLGDLVVFLSERVEHEVLPARAPRWAVTAWYHGP